MKHAWEKEKKPLVILTGPTAVGKTKLSIELAKALDGEIISADSMQVYRYMDVGTAKITKDEMDGVTHYLIDEIDPREEFNVVKFQTLAKHYMEDIYRKEKVPIIVGGTGFYIQSVLYDINFAENEEDTTYRMELEELAKQKGANYLHEMLKDIDPISYESIHENNIKRVIRALEYYKQTGTPISAHNEEQRKNESPYAFTYFVLNNEREVLYKNIDKRVDIMVDNGLLDEVKHLKDLGYTRDLVSMQGLGYKEILAYLDGECTLEEAIYILKRDTRHFAKRQLTWFKREKDVTWVNKQEFDQKEEEILSFMLKVCKERNSCK